MTWVLNASGHSPAPEGSNDWHEVEQEMFGELAAVLAKPEYGCSSSSFGGNYVSGMPHLHHDPQTEHIHETAEAEPSPVTGDDEKPDGEPALD